MPPEERIAPDAVPLPLLGLDRSGCINSANLLAQENLGASLKKLIGRHLSELFAPEAEVNRLLRHAGELRESVSDHGLCQRVTEAPYSLHVGAHEGGLTVVLVPEANRARVEQHAKRREMAEAVARIALEMAHEVKNPLAALRGAAQWLSEQPLDPDAREATEMMIREVDRVRARIDTFLQLGPRADVKMERVNIHTLIDDVCRPPERVQLQRVFDPSLPPLTAHVGRLRQAIENLWSNALEAEPTHVEWQTRVAAAVKLPDHAGAVLEVRVTNDGAAIPRELLPRLFEPFVTNKRRGSGLGLAIVQRVVLEHGGRVQVQAEAGRTSFVIQLPIRSGDDGDTRS